MNLFENLDMIIEAAVNDTIGDERSRQKKQSKSIDKLNLRAGDDNKDDVEEADDDKDSPDEDESKLKGDARSPESAAAPDSAGNPGTATSKKMRDPSRSQIKNPSFKSIAANINLLRGGKSIKDPEVKKNLQAYIDKLTKDERRQVLVYLNSLAQVMSGVKTGSAAADPSQAEKTVKVKERKKKKRDIVKKTSVIVVGE